MFVSIKSNLKKQARAIFAEALRAVDAGDAVRKFVKISDSSSLIVGEEIFDITAREIYAIALGKAAYPMATALDDVFGGRLAGGVVSGVIPERVNSDGSAVPDEMERLSQKWVQFSGGHPLPNQASLDAAQNCFDLLRSANEQKAVVIFLVSGGGSAMIEALRSSSITLAELRETNRLLVSCGAAIAEINSVRRAVSLVKGGGLAMCAPLADQITLIVSDTEPGDEASVASGPSLKPPVKGADDVNQITERYDLTSRLPNSVLRLIQQTQSQKIEPPDGIRRHHVLLNNQSAIKAAVAAAIACGFAVETANDLAQQPITEGCAKLVERITNLRRRTNSSQVACLISGGEFSCPVKGVGVGGRNSETALRMALMFEESKNFDRNSQNEKEIVFLSAGTDGIDGNSPAAGAIGDETTLLRARELKLDARCYLDDSDAYTFFQLLGDAIVTGPTGTNVRDLRILLVS